MKLSSVSNPNFFFFSKNRLTILCPFHFLVNFRISLYISTKNKKQKQKPAGIVIRIALTLYVSFGGIVILIIPRFPFHESRISLHLFRSLSLSLSNVLLFNILLLLKCISGTTGWLSCLDDCLWLRIF